MSKFVITLLVAISLLIAPIAHAAGLDCAGGNCQASEQSEQSSKISKTDTQDDGKMSADNHHCCCVHASARLDTSSHQNPQPVSSNAVFIYKVNLTASVVVGPPLKPPSHA